MKIRYQYESQTQGLIVLESEPQTRTIFIASQFSKSIRLSFPYLYHILSYEINKNYYIYNGVYDRGLMVFLRNEPLKTFDDMLYFSPTDMEMFGVSCTDHNYDKTSYNSVSSLVSDIVGLWWHTQHLLDAGPSISRYGIIPSDLPHIDYYQKINWKNQTPEEVLKIKWNPAFSLRNVLRFDGYLRGANYYSAPLAIPLDARLS